MEKFCDRCGVKLTEENNKQGFNICDKCNEELEKERSKIAYAKHEGKTISSNIYCC